MDRERATWGSAYHAQGLVFPTEDGRPQDGSEATKRFKRAVARRPELPVIVFHGLRHTHATLLLEDGVSLKVVAQRLGDREETVLRTYNHVLPRGMAIAASRVAAWLEPGPPTQPVSDEVALLRAQVRELQAHLAAYEPDSQSSKLREQSVSETPETAVVSVGANHDPN